MQVKTRVKYPVRNHVSLSEALLLVFITGGMAMPVCAATELSPVAVIGHDTDSFSPGSFTGHHQRIEREEFTRYFIQLADLLEQQSGVTVQSIGGVGQYASPLIRGSSGHQVLVYWDGLLINALNGGSANLSNISLQQAAQVDIYRSLAPVELSASAVGGVIQLHSRTNTSDNLDSGDASLTYGSYGVAQYNLSQGFGSSQSRWLVSADILQADNDFTYREQQPVSNPQQPADEPRYNNGSEQYHLLLKGVQQLPGSRADIALQTSRNERGISSRINSPSNNASLTTEQNSLQLRWQRPWTTRHTSEIQGGIYQQTERYDDRDSRIGLGAQLNQYNSHGSRLQLSQDLTIDALNAVFLLRTQQEETDTEFLLLNAEEAEQQCRNGQGCETAYKRAQHDLGARLNYVSGAVTISAQFSRILLTDKNLQRQDNNREIHANTWSAAFSRRFHSGLDWYVHLSDQVRLPTTGEVFGDRGNRLGNPDLLPEKALHYETGIKFQTARAEFHSSIYVRYLQDAIIAESDSRGVIRFDNLSRSRHTGFEQDIRWNPITPLYLTASLTLQSNTITRHDRIPFYEGNQAAGYSQLYSFISARWQQDSWDFSVSHTRELGGYYNNSNLLEKDTVNRWDAGIGVYGYDWRLSLNVSDITDDAARDYPFYPEPGRMIFVRAHYQW